MRILLDARYLDGTFSGIGTYTRHLVEHLARVDQTNQYIILVQPSFHDTLSLGPNFEVRTYNHAPVSLATILLLGRYVDSLDVDLMHSLFPVAPLWMKTPLAITVHDLQPFIDPDFNARRPILLQILYRLFYNYIYPASMRRAKWIINVSFHTRDMVLDFFPHELAKLLVVRSGIDRAMLEPSTVPIEEVQRELGINNRYVLYYGSTRPNKNLPNIIRGFAYYLNESGDKETELVLIVKKDRFFRDVARVIRKQGVGSQVRVLSQVSPTQQRALLAGARAFVFATKYEGFGFPALEAMATGVPVIAGLSGSLPEICGDAAEFVHPEDSSQIGDAIGALLPDSPARDNLIAEGRARVATFDWTDAAERVRDIYKLLF